MHIPCYAYSHTQHSPSILHTYTVIHLFFYLFSLVVFLTTARLLQLRSRAKLLFSLFVLVLLNNPVRNNYEYGLIPHHRSQWNMTFGLTVLFTSLLLHSTLPYLTLPNPVTSLCQVPFWRRCHGKHGAHVHKNAYAWSLL